MLVFTGMRNVRGLHETSRTIAPVKCRRCLGPSIGSKIPSEASKLSGKLRFLVDYPLDWDNQGLDRLLQFPAPRVDVSNVRIRRLVLELSSSEAFLPREY